MKELYTIGEVSALLGISPQTLRFYSNNGLISPRYVDPDSGYRFYAYNQFHIIDRIKYLQSLGFTLTDIREALRSGEVGDLLPYLEKQRQKALEEMEQAKKVAEKLEWYLHYYRYLEDDRFPEVPFKKTFPRRYLLAADCLPGEALFGPCGYRLTDIRREQKLSQAEYLRQNGYLLDFDALMERRIEARSYFVYLREKPPFDHPAVREIPAGTYLCFRGRLLLGEWNPDHAIRLLKGRVTSSLVVADEYEHNLREFMSCTYEVQILL